MAFIEATPEQRQTFTRELATALGEGWSADIDCNGEYIHCSVKHQDGHGVHVHHETAWNGKPMRITLSGIWPVDSQRQMYVPSNGSAHSITVAADKAPSKIASDIKNRFLPIYLEQYASCKQRADSSNAYELATRRTIADLKEAIPGRTGGSSHLTSTFYPERSHVYQVTAQGSSVRFEAFNCPVSVAIFLLKAARKVSIED